MRIRSLLPATALAVGLVGQPASAAGCRVADDPARDIAYRAGQVETPALATPEAPQDGRFYVTTQDGRADIRTVDVTAHRKMFLARIGLAAGDRPEHGPTASAITYRLEFTMGGHRYFTQVVKTDAESVYTAGRADKGVTYTSAGETYWSSVGLRLPWRDVSDGAVLSDFAVTASGVLRAAGDPVAGAPEVRVVDSASSAVTRVVGTRC